MYIYAYIYMCVYTCVYMNVSGAEFLSGVRGAAVLILCAAICHYEEFSSALSTQYGLAAYLQQVCLCLRVYLNVVVRINVRVYMYVSACVLMPI